MSGEKKYSSPVWRGQFVCLLCLWKVSLFFFLFFKEKKNLASKAKKGRKKNYFVILSWLTFSAACLALSPVEAEE